MRYRLERVVREADAVSRVAGVHRSDQAVLELAVGHLPEHDPHKQPGDDEPEL